MLNTIVAESLDYVATELEQAVGAKPSPARAPGGACVAVLKKSIKQHKRVIFNGDGYSEEWHAEAERRGPAQPHDSVEAFPVLRARRMSTSSGSTACWARRSSESRIHIAIEKYVKQIMIEAETMVSMARGQILPAALEHQRRVAEAVAATKEAGVERKTPPVAARVRGSGGRVPPADRGGRKAGGAPRARPARHAVQIARQLKPAMARLREMGDNLESLVAAELWPLPTYRGSAVL